MERQPYLRLCKNDATANVRMDYVNKETMTEYFNLLKKCPVRAWAFWLAQPNQCWWDQHAIRASTSKSCNKERPKKKVRCQTSGNRSQITVIGCVSATGQAIPLFVIFNTKRLNMEWRKGEILGTFKKSGVFQFNTEAIDCGVGVNKTCPWSRCWSGDR